MIKRIYGIALLLALMAIYQAPLSGQAKPSVLQPDHISQSGEATISETALQRALELFQDGSTAHILIPATINRDSAQPSQPRRHFESNFILGGAEAFPM